MRVVVSANAEGLDAQASPMFGRCPAYVFVETDDLTASSMANPAIGASGGAGIQAAQLVIEQGVQAVITGNVGPNALQVFQASSIPVYQHAGGSVRDAVEAFIAGKLTQVMQPTSRAHSGMPGANRGTGSGGGRGMGGGGGKGMGGGRGGAGS